MAYSLLTPTALRWSTLSATSRKEGKKEISVLTLFTACGREGGRAKQRPGE